jgi:hypothetical protein
MHPDTTFGKISGAVELRATIEASKAKNLQTSRKNFIANTVPLAVSVG